MDVVVLGGDHSPMPNALVTLIAISTGVSLSCVTTATPEITCVLAHGSQDEEKTCNQIQQLTREYDLSGWVWTQMVVIESRAIPHSHPKLTLSTRQYADRLLLLSTFVHEEYHWYESMHPEQTAKAIAELRTLYPALPVGGLDGAADEQSSYLHIIVCYAEYHEMKALVGEERARNLMEFWANDHYRKIYRLVLENEHTVEDVVQRNGLLPKP
jgi:hypothetical protein